MTREQHRQHFAGQVKAARETLNISQEDLAHILGIPRTSLSHLESGIREVTAWEFIALRGLLGIRQDAQTTASITVPLVSKLKSIALYREREKLIRKIGEIPPEDTAP